MDLPQIEFEAVMRTRFRGLSNEEKEKIKKEQEDVSTEEVLLMLITFQVLREIFSTKISINKENVFILITLTI